MPYVTNCGPTDRVARYGERPFAIGVLDPDGGNVGLPIGIAYPTGWGDRGAALWRLVVNKVELPGRYVLDRQRFELADGRT